MKRPGFPCRRPVRGPAATTLLFLVMVLAGPVAHAQEPEDGTDCRSMDALAFMLGSWRHAADGTVFTEAWTREPDGSFRGYAESYKAEDGEVFQSEAMVIEPRDGVLTYVVDLDSAGHPVAFRLVACEGGVARFENPDHDFPQRLEYRRASPDRMTATVSDLEDHGFDLDFEAVRPEDGDS